MNSSDAIRMKNERIGGWYFLDVTMWYMKTASGEHCVSVIMKGNEPLGVKLTPVDGLSVASRSIVFDKSENDIRELETHWTLMSAPPP
jgi:hypothetical protein